MDLKIDQTFKILEASLNGSATRQKLIAHNISNLNTPGFKSYLVDVEANIKDLVAGQQNQLQLKTSSPRHISGGNNSIETKITRDTSTGRSADGNNVDLADEMVAMAKNNIYYNGALNQLNKKIAMLKYVISDGRG